MRSVTGNDAEAARRARRLRACLISAGALGCLQGCGSIGAPSLSLFGAFFPGWLACGILGMTGGGISRAIMLGTGLSERLPFQLAVNVAIGLIVALLAWLVWFGR